MPGPNDSTNRFYVTWMEWLDLEPVKDFVSLSTIRPRNQVEILNRTGITTKIQPDRDGAFSHRYWERQWVSVDPTQEGDTYFQWNLRSDASVVAAGWYIDDVRVFQPAVIQGTLSGPSAVGNIVEARGTDGWVLGSAVSDETGFFRIGPLPAGRYILQPTDGEPIFVNVGAGETSEANGGLPIPVGDSDEDGLPNSWEDEFPCVDRNTPDADVDADSDGKTNEEEFLAGTDPCDPLSVLAIIMIARQSDGVHLTWTSEPERLYRVWVSDDFGTWNVIGPDVIADAATTEIVDPGATPQRMYRVELIQN